MDNDFVKADNIITQIVNGITNRFSGVFNDNKNNDCDEHMGDRKASLIGAESSMSTLILWNISKALQRNPNLNLKEALGQAHNRLDNTRDVNKIITQSPEERHLACALLAWHELGHSTADSLYRFIEEKLEDHERNESKLMVQNTKIKIISTSDRSQNVQTVNHQHNKTSNHQECAHSGNKESLKCPHKANKESKPCLVKNTRKVESTMIDDSTRPVCSHSGSKVTKCGTVKYTNLSNNESNSGSCSHKLEPSKSNHSTYSKHIHKDVSEENTERGSNYCVLNMRSTNKTELSKCPFMKAAYNPTPKCVSAECHSSESFDTGSLKGPVVTLPPQTKVVMRLDSQSPCARHQGKKKEKDIMSKIDAACCMDTACAERLSELDKATTELRNRAARLARREAERVELLERAEAAWKDLELGYQRRLSLAEEKEYDMAKETKKLIEERNGYKAACMNLAKVLKEKGEATEKDRQVLVQVEKDMCALACVRMRQSEEAAKTDAATNEQQIKVAQQDRDLQFKEEQTRRKLLVIQGEIDSVRALTIEAERAMRAELAALREQVETVSKQLLREDDDSSKIKTELDSLRDEKLGLVEDLEGCQVTCDSRMQKKMEELKNARERLKELKEKVMECKCKIPIDAEVEVKRTPSLAALCTCSPEDRLLESCSCTSLRSQLLSNLLADLFGGLQSELGDVAAQMPCQYLKCLEDRHNWDKGSLVKSNLRSYFSKLLIGELDIAIATAIEKYHARWVGASCADAMRAIPDTGDGNTEGWQERAIERKAQKLANKLAEQLFQERADQVAQRAKDVMKSGPPPCECRETAVFPCFVKPPTIDGSGMNPADNGATISSYWRKTCKDVTQLRVQIEDLKKETLKKEDLKIMEERIFKLVQRPSEPESPEEAKENKHKEETNIDGNNNKDAKCHNRSVNTEETSKYSHQNSRPTSIRKRNMEINNFTKRNAKKVINEQPDRLNKNYKRNVPAYAVNTCFCGNQNLMPKLIGEDITSHKLNAESEDKTIRKQSLSKNVSDQISSSKHSKPISGGLESAVINSEKSKKFSSCKSGCVCFHKIPSNTSIDKLLEKLEKWRCDLNETTGKENYKNNKTTNFDMENIQHQQDYEPNKSVFGMQSNKINHASDPIFPDNFINHNIATNLNTNTNILPSTTESEYMGAINLDKSNEQCKCTAKQQKLNKGKDRKESKIQGSNSPFKCINSELCQCKKSLDNNNNTSQINNENSRQEASKTNTYTEDLLPENDTSYEITKLRNKQQFQEFSENVIDNENTEVNKNDTGVNHYIKSSELFPCDCDYYVKLLGVTLANISSHKVFENKSSISNRKHKTETVTSQENIKDSPNKDRSENDGSHLNSCQCHVQFDEFKNYMENNFRKQWGDHSTNDKELDVPSFKEIATNKEEPCICCNNNAVNESRELEVNTFYLLEEHLRGRLDDLKKTCCKVSCLPSDEEEKLFSAILQRVKQIISSSTNEITCKCKEGKHLDGSWNRANALLQEYLKTKMKKVQCLCTNENDKQECVLPKVLDEIHSLIEKDFQRLKNVYKYKNIDNSTEKHKGRKDEIPEKDIDSDKNYKKSNMPMFEIPTKPRSGKDVERLSKLNSNHSMITKQSMTSQIPLNMEMATKSCDAMEKETKLIQTSGLIKKIIDENFNSVETEICDCDSMIDTYSYDTQDLDNNHNMKDVDSDKSNEQKQSEVDNFDEKVSSPYIGFTVDCSCKCALGTCTCIKSTIARNNEQINTLWNDLTKDNIQSQKYSYIMDGTSDNHKTRPVNYAEVDLAVNTAIKIQTSENIDSYIGDEEITLKDSCRNVVVSNNSANTTNDNNYVSDYSPRDEERHEICECRIIKPILKNTIRSESHLPNSINMHKTQSLNCDCNMVPICHVKMLVDSLENRIYHSKCTCDSFNPRVCPVHSIREY